MSILDIKTDQKYILQPMGVSGEITAALQLIGLGKHCSQVR